MSVRQHLDAMRTTLTIEDGLLRQLRQKALDSGKPFKQVVNETMQAGLNQPAAAPRKPYVCPTFSIGALASGVDLTKANQLAADLEDEERIRDAASGPVILIDTNIWLDAALRESPLHSVARTWLEATFNGDEPIALPWSVALAVLGISTHSRLMLQPLISAQALDLIEGWLQHPLVAVVQPGPDHWTLLRGLIEQAGTAGNLTSDAYLAALAMENDCTLFSADSDFRRFQGLRFHNPLALTSP